MPGNPKMNCQRQLFLSSHTRQLKVQAVHLQRLAETSRETYMQQPIMPNNWPHPSRSTWSSEMSDAYYAKQAKFITTSRQTLKLISNFESLNWWTNSMWLPFLASCKILLHALTLCMKCNSYIWSYILVGSFLQKSSFDLFYSIIFQKPSVIY